MNLSASQQRVADQVTFHLFAWDAAPRAGSTRRPGGPQSTGESVMVNACAGRFARRQTSVQAGASRLKRSLFRGQTALIL